MLGYGRVLTAILAFEVLVAFCVSSRETAAERGRNRVSVLDGSEETTAGDVPFGLHGFLRRGMQGKGGVGAGQVQAA